MTELEFYQGWALLCAQEYARHFAFDETKYELQTGLYKRALIEHDSAAYKKAVEWWILRQSTFPLLPELLDLVRQSTPKPQPTTSRQLTHQDDGDTPWREVVQAWIRGEGSIRSVASRIVPDWITQHPEDFDSKRQWDVWKRRYGYDSETAR